VTPLLDHAFTFELGDVGSAAIEVERQCRRADGCSSMGAPKTLIILATLASQPAAFRIGEFIGT